MESLPNLGVTFSSETVISLTFLVIVGIYAVFSAIFYYHWITYSNDGKVTSLTLLVYAGTTLPLLLFLATMTFFI